MREIKFRAWDSGRNRMIAPGIDGAEVYVHSRSAYIPALGDFEDLTLLQFTGLKDKNGIEIYEGDVIKFKVDFENQEFDYGVVRWADGGYWTSQTTDDLEELLSIELKELESEVAGNIHENPELLKK